MLESISRVPVVAEALRRIVTGHPTARRVRDVLEARGESELVAEELRRGGKP